ncbi:hypothetical protein BKA63DRAFT_266555 [Paraphoma chrysanthemicola]|nr:hypothetical protein BKA63DRAFT_266555 [Paraphoma chrysanthemicola]
MGNCGSSLDCDKCYSQYEIPGCVTEINLNPNVAGTGVLASFLCSAILLSGIYMWGYIKLSLPSKLLQPTDHHVLRLFRNWRVPFDDADVKYWPIAYSRDQLRHTRAVTNCVKMLGAQQLITGLAILVAGLASRCQITLYEFNIVTSLAYFAMYTHVLSLHVVRGYMYEHVSARNWHVAMTVAFLILFCFSFVINTVSYGIGDTVNSDLLNAGSALQCLFEARRHHKTIKFEPLAISLVMGAFILEHIVTIGNLYLPPEVDFISAVRHQLRSSFRTDPSITREKRLILVNNAELKYSAWLRPTTTGTGKSRISIWYFLELYYDSELSVIASYTGIFSYGIGTVVLGVWHGGLKPSEELQSLGFGQVVALGLLALTLLSMTEVHNEQKILDQNILESDPQSSMSTDNVDHDLNVGDGTEVDETYDVNNSETSTDVCALCRLDASDADDDAVSKSTTVDFDASGTAGPETNSTRTSQVPKRPDRFNRFLQKLVGFGVPKTTQELNLVKKGVYNDGPGRAIVAERTAKVASFLFLVHLGLSLYLGIGWALDTTYIGPWIVWSIYAFYRSLLALKRGLNVEYFYRQELDDLQGRNSCPKVSQPTAGSSRSSGALVASPRVITLHQSHTSSTSVSTIRTWDTKDEHIKKPPSRRDTENDIGLIPLRRATYPAAQEG